MYAGLSRMLDDFAHEMDSTETRMDNVMKKMAKVLHMSNGKDGQTEFNSVDDLIHWRMVDYKLLWYTTHIWLKVYNGRWYWPIGAWWYMDVSINYPGSSLVQVMALLPVWCQAASWNNADVMSIEGAKFSAILIKILKYYFEKMHWKTLSSKYQLFYLGLNVSIASDFHNIFSPFYIIALNIDCSLQCWYYILMTNPVNWTHSKLMFLFLSFLFVSDRRQWCAIGILILIMVIVIILFFVLWGKMH